MHQVVSLLRRGWLAAEVILPRRFFFRLVIHFSRSGDSFTAAAAFFVSALDVRRP